MSYFTEPIETEQLWSRNMMGMIWNSKENFDTQIINKIDVLFKSRQKDSVTGKSKIIYSLPKDKYASKLGFGRLYSKGFETFENEVRGSLCAAYYYDIDVQNCHPTLLHQFAQKIFGIDSPETKKFCANRDAYYKEIDINKDVAKSEIFRILYGGTCSFPALQPLKQECDSLAIKIAQHPTYADLFAACSKANENNPLGSLLSYVLQTEERKVMLCMREFFIQFGWSVDVLCYDGIMIRKQKDKLFSENLLLEAEQYILNKTGYVVKLTNKPFSCLNIEENNQLISQDILINDSYAAEQLIKLAGDTVLQYNGEYFCLINDVWCRGEAALRSLIHLHKDKLVFRQIANTKIKIFDYGGCEKNITPLLKQLPLYIPKKDLPIKFEYCYFDTLPSQEGLQRFLELITLWTQNNDLLKQYVLNWFAHLIQKPKENPGVMLIVTGAKGCGKDTVVDFLLQFVIGKEFGNSYNKTAQFFDFYDIGKRNKLLVRLEEANRELCLKNQDTLKTYITSATMEINQKHKDACIVDNFTRYIFTTNKGNPVAFTDQERRFVLLPCSAEKQSQASYWEETREVLFTKETGKAVGEYLATLDISNFNPRVYPSTSYQEGVIETEVSPEERFINEWDGVEVNASKFFELYRDFCFVSNYTPCTNSSTFGKKLINFIRDNKIKKRMLDGRTFYSK